MIKKEEILEILGEHTEWYESQWEDLIHVGKFDSIAESIVKLCNKHFVSNNEVAGCFSTRCKHHNKTDNSCNAGYANCSGRQTDC